jgi:hypothetical protein
MKTLLSRFPEDIDQKYNLNAFAVDGWVYIKTRKGMYGLKQAGLLANKLLQIVWHHLDITRHTTHLDSGCIEHSQSLSLSWWTILQLSTWASNTQSISETPYYALMN